MTMTIYHNPKCSNSRGALALIREAGIEPEIVDYLGTPPGRETLVALMQRAGATPRDWLRAKEPLAAELGLNDPAAPDEAILDALLAHPLLLNRPIVASDRGVVLARPPERVSTLLPK